MILGYQPTLKNSLMRCSNGIFAPKSMWGFRILLSIDPLPDTTERMGSDDVGGVNLITLQSKASAPE